MRANDSAAASIVLANVRTITNVEILGPRSLRITRGAYADNPFGQFVLQGWGGRHHDRQGLRHRESLHAAVHEDGKRLLPRWLIHLERPSRFAGKPPQKLEQRTVLDDDVG